VRSVGSSGPFPPRGSPSPFCTSELTHRYSYWSSWYFSLYSIFLRRSGVRLMFSIVNEKFEGCGERGDEGEKENEREQELVAMRARPAESFGRRMQRGLDENCAETHSKEEKVGETAEWSGESKWRDLLQRTPNGPDGGPSGFRSSPPRAPPPPGPPNPQPSFDSVREHIPIRC
jgi:hypothetical protein